MRKPAPATGGRPPGRAFPTDGDAAPGDRPAFARWWLAVWLVLFTHPLLDAFTVYGTQLWWPLPLRPVAIGSVFIVDPLYTLPLLIGLAWALRSRTALARRANGIGIAASTAYLALTLAVQAHVTSVARESLAAEGAEAARLLVAPLPMSILWRVVALDGGVYREGWCSVLDDAPRMRFAAHERGGMRRAQRDVPARDAADEAIEMLRFRALTIPVVTVFDRPSGAPIATVWSPTFSSEESANSIGVRPEASESLITARS